MNNKQFLRIVVASVMALSVVSTASVPYITNSGVLYVSAETYETVSNGEALTSAIPSESGQTAYIKLGDNITQSITIPEGATVYLDLNGHTLTNTSGTNYTILNEGALTIEDSSVTDTSIYNVDYISNDTEMQIQCGKVIADTTGYNALWNKGTATINGGQFIQNSTSTKGYLIKNHYTNSPNEKNENVKLTITNGRFTLGRCTGTSSMMQNYANLEVNGGYFYNNSSVFKNEETSKFKMTGGTVTSKNLGSSNTLAPTIYCYGDINITGGHITAETDSAYSLWSITYQDYVSNTFIGGDVLIDGDIDISTDDSSSVFPNLEINSGTINGDIKVGSSFNLGEITADVNSGKITITGGTINGDVVLYTTDDFNATYINFDMSGGSVDSVDLGTANLDKTNITGGIFKEYPEDYITGNDTVAVGITNGDITTYYISKDNADLVTLLNDNNAIGSTGTSVEVMKVATDNSTNPLDLTGVENIENATVSANENVEGNITIMGEPIELFTKQPLDNSNKYEYELVSEDTNNTITISEDKKTVTGNAVGTTQIKYTNDNITIIQDVTVKAFEVTSNKNVSITSTSTSLTIETNNQIKEVTSNNKYVTVNKNSDDNTKCIVSCSATGTRTATITITDIYGNTDTVTVSVNIPKPTTPEVTTVTEATTITEESTTSTEETTATEDTTTSTEVTTVTEESTTSTDVTTVTEESTTSTDVTTVTEESTTSTDVTTVTEESTTSADVTTVTKESTTSEKVTTKNEDIKVNTSDDITVSDTPIEIGKEYHAVISTPEGDSFPENIEVMVNGVLLSPNQYTYVDGELTIPAEYVTGDITIATKSEDDTTTTTTVTTSNDNPSTTALWGDIDSNNEIDARDVLILKKYLLQMLTADEVGTQGLSNADVTHDDEVTAPDLVKLKKYVLTMITQDDLAVVGA